MIVTNAGHIYHGKSSLVAALTTQRTDRLLAEPWRVMTIESGFTLAKLGDVRVVDFVDLPGHDRSVHHMLVGATAADVALLVVAADGGPMPQTLDHLNAMRVLQSPTVLPVVNKVDRFDATRE